MDKNCCTHALLTRTIWILKASCPAERRRAKNTTIWQRCWHIFEKHIAPWANPQSELNKKRWEILSACLAAGEGPKGIYTLSTPTGSGKTTASLAFALKHAVKHSMQRIIYVIPYTSIIDQNAKVFREILHDKNVLEHHSGIVFDKEDKSFDSADYKSALAAENWDAPVVVTTAVQFFESFYANRTSKCRKLHNVTNSVMIFDEVQMMPSENLLPCVAAISTLCAHFNSHRRVVHGNTAGGGRLY